MENKKDLKISELKDMQYKLWELNKNNWEPIEPEYAKNNILYMVEELGETISIIKKKGIDSIMNDKNIRERFIEEFGDVLMYYIDVLNRTNISAEEFTEVYMKKYNGNLKRNYVEDNKKKYV